MATTHIISDELKLNRVLTNALRAFRRKVLPLRAFATRYDNVPLDGTDKMSIPYYPLSTSKSRKRKPRGSYKALAHDTQTDSREVVIDQNLVQAISFTTEQLNRQPVFDPAVHGALMGEQLAIDVLNNVFGNISAGRFKGTSIAATTKENFDENDIASLAEICDDENWPETGRSLIMRPAFGYNLAIQPALIDLSQSGDKNVLREGSLPRLMGFETHRTSGMQNNSGTSLVFTADPGTDKLTVSGFTYAADNEENVADYFRAGDAIEVSTDDTLPGGLAVDTRYYVVNVDAANNTLQLSATQGFEGAAINITNTGTGPHAITRKENLGAIATANGSGLLVGFVPQSLTPAMRADLYDYRVIKDKGSDLVLEYRHFADGDTGEEVQVIECHFGTGFGEYEAIKRVEQLPSN